MQNGIFDTDKLATRLITEKRAGTGAVQQLFHVDHQPRLDLKQNTVIFKRDGNFLPKQASPFIFPFFGTLLSWYYGNRFKIEAIPVETAAVALRTHLAWNVLAVDICGHNQTECCEIPTPIRVLVREATFPVERSESTRRAL